MMKPTMCLFFSLGLFLSTTSYAQPRSSLRNLILPKDSADVCSEFSKNFDPWRFFRYESQSPGLNKDCFLSVMNVSVPGFVYRSYLFSNGSLMVFNSYNDSDSDGTGARLFYFFPRLAVPDIEDNGDLISAISSFPAIRLVMNYKTGALVGFSGLTAKIDPKVTPENNGGVEILSASTLWLDVGYAQGHDPSTEPSRKSVFHDVNGKTCSVKNSEIFKLFSSGDVEFSMSDAALKTFLKARCPHLSVNY